MKNTQRIFHTLMIAVMFFTPANLLALSDLDTTFLVQQHGQEKKLRCNFLKISSGNLTCTEGALVTKIPVANIKQLEVMYMGKEFHVSDINQNDIESANGMSIKKEQALLERKRQIQEKKEAELRDPEVKRITACKEVASLAKLIMEKRQDEIPMHKLLEIAHDQKNGFAETVKLIVKQAYSEIAMRTDENKIRQQNEFSNKIFKSCYGDN